MTGWGNGQYLGYVVNWDLIVWVQGERREGFDDARFLLRLMIWVMQG